MKKTYKINEIFYSIQGEGANAGVPAVFVRFSGCNRRCPFCDTDHESGVEMTAQQIRQAVEKASDGLKTMVVLTGGEPTLQLSDEENLFPDAGDRRLIAIETNGTGAVPSWIDWVTVSPKDDIPLDKLPRFNEVKLLFDETRLDYFQLFNQDGITAFIQPIERSGEYNFDEAIAFVKQNPRFRLSVQIHKLIGMQ
ncbi:MAG: radical SAM protein [Thermoguttaceae bacterium]|nr:radical SAM protein [Thermoguttaceae bacterium]